MPVATHDTSLWPDQGQDDSNSRAPHKNLLEDFMAEEADNFDLRFQKAGALLGDYVNGGGAADGFAFPHPTQFRLKLAPFSAVYTGPPDPVHLAAQDGPFCSAPEASLNRIDVLVLDWATPQYLWILGTPAATPAIPPIPSNRLPLWAVYIRPGAGTTFDPFGRNLGTNSYIYRDLRPKYRTPSTGGGGGILPGYGDLDLSACKLESLKTTSSTTPSVTSTSTGLRVIESVVVMSNGGGTAGQRPGTLYLDLISVAGANYTCVLQTQGTQPKSYHNVFRPRVARERAAWFLRNGDQVRFRGALTGTDQYDVAVFYRDVLNVVDLSYEVNIANWGDVYIPPFDPVSPNTGLYTTNFYFLGYTIHGSMVYTGEIILGTRTANQNGQDGEIQARGDLDHYRFVNGQDLVGWIPEPHPRGFPKEAVLNLAWYAKMAGPLAYARVLILGPA